MKLKKDMKQCDESNYLTNSTHIIFIKMCDPSITPLILTFAAVLPHAQVNLRDVVTAAVAMRELGHRKDILLDTCDVVPVVAQHSG